MKGEYMSFRDSLKDLFREKNVEEAEEAVQELEYKAGVLKEQAKTAAGKVFGILKDVGTEAVQYGRKAAATSGNLAYEGVRLGYRGAKAGAAGAGAVYAGAKKGYKAYKSAKKKAGWAKARRYDYVEPGVVPSAYSSTFGRMGRATPDSQSVVFGNKTMPKSNSRAMRSLRKPHSTRVLFGD